MTRQLPILRALWKCRSLSAAAAWAMGGAAVGSAQSASVPAIINPAWSPDGRSIAFEWNRDGKFAVYVVGSDGTSLRKLTAGAADDVQPRWSPDGKTIAFVSNRGGRDQVYVMDADGAKQRALIPNERAQFVPSFSPDGKQIAFGAQDPRKRTLYYVFVVNADGSNLRQLTDSTRSSEEPTWSTDGRRIAFSTVPLLDRLPNETGRDFIRRREQERKQVSVNVDGGGATKSWPPLVRAADLSSDGNHQAIVKTDGVPGLYVRDLASGNDRLIVDARR